MAKHVLITGGAGFIGSHLADELLAAGYRVRILDSLAAQVHGPEGKTPVYLTSEAELMQGDVRDLAAMKKALVGVDGVVHLAASVGVGQSMYQVSEYVSVNDLGTAILLQTLIERPVERLVVASSMSVYGEGLYLDADGNRIEERCRDARQGKLGIWDLHDQHGRPLIPLPTPESKRPMLASVYALSKYVQEQSAILVGRAYGIPTVALRFFNVYGSRQALSNPYTGVLAIFAARLLNSRQPIIFEDGKQLRDFIHVHDVARACRMALEKESASGQVLNIGSGRSYTICDLAEQLAATLGRPQIKPEISGRYRVGDIRHCFADTSRAGAILGFTPQTEMEDGMEELAEWLTSQSALDRFEEARAELFGRGLAL